MSATLNIGLNVGQTVAALTPLAVLAVLRSTGRQALREALVESDTEPTLVVEVDVPFSGPSLAALSERLKQDAVAQWDGQRGLLAGPRAADWGPFDPAFFFTLDGARLAEQPARAA